MKRGLEDPMLSRNLPKRRSPSLRRRRRDGRGACATPFELEFYRPGHLTPVCSSSGAHLTISGWRVVLNGSGALLAPPPARPTAGRAQPTRPRKTGEGRIGFAGLV